MLTECIILAGGLGTRLRSVVADQPKVLAEVNGFPFLKYIIDHALSQGCKHIILSTGYMHEKVEEFIGNHYPQEEISFAIEEDPLGTGGGILNALKKCKTDDVIVLNGDTFFNIRFSDLYEQYLSHHSVFSIALKQMQKFSRYGTVTCNQDGRILSFNEKQFMATGLINAGIYIVNRKLFMSMNWPEKFSMEKDFMEKYTDSLSMHGFTFDEYFIDIGIPEDYAKAQDDFKSLF